MHSIKHRITCIYLELKDAFNHPFRPCATRLYKIKFYLRHIIPSLYKTKWMGQNAFMYRYKRRLEITKERNETT